MIMETQKDKYDLAVEYLTEHPEEIYDVWVNPWKHPYGCLFLGVTPSGHLDVNPEGDFCGCLLMVKSGDPAWTRELTEAIRADESIPKTGNNITVSHLPIFAQWQRRIDKELGRKI